MNWETLPGYRPVSYTHLDVYKRQVKYLIGDEQINKQDYTPETFDVDLVVEGHFGEKGDLESLSPTFEAPKELVYNGQLYANSFRILQAKVYSNWIFNYTKNNKIVQPINVGEYTLVVSRPADSKYQAYTSEPMAFKITKATPTVVADEITGAYPGLELKDLKLSGTATVEGLGTIDVYKRQMIRYRMPKTLKSVSAR